MDDRILKLAGLSDLFRLASATIRYPDDELCLGLCDGSLTGDIARSLAAIGADEATLASVEALLDGIEAGSEADSNASLDPSSASGSDQVVITRDLRLEYTRLFLAPREELVSLYESRFTWPADKDQSDCLMFVNDCCMDVERMMKAGGFAPVRPGSQPVDHIAIELEYLGLLCGKAAQALASEGAVASEDAAVSEDRAAQEQAHMEQVQLDQAREFWDAHLSRWVAPFFSEVAQATRLAQYRDVAGLLARVFETCVPAVIER